jgi:hypothetical protein
MLGMETRAPLVERQGRQWQFGAYVVEVAISGETAAFALGDGTLRRVPLDPQADAAPMETPAHDGACLALAADAAGFISGGDDGRLRRTLADGAGETLLERPGKWIEHVTTPSSGGFIACAIGKTLIVLPKRGEPMALPHDSSIAAVAVDPRGKRIATAHYGGASLWWANGRSDQKPERLAWKGSHISLTWSEDGRFIVTGMQEQALHGWRLADGKDMRMSGYPAKTRSFSWTPKGRLLATSGADHVICWPFIGKDGPMGRPPLEIGMPGALIRKVACHPKVEIIAAGREDGSIVLYRLDQEGVVAVKDPGDGEVTALLWREDGRALLFGTERGAAGMIWFLPK